MLFFCFGGRPGQLLRFADVAGEVPYILLFLPAAKLTGHGMSRVVLLLLLVTSN